MPRRPDGLIRAFGMSGAQISTEIENLEHRFDIELSSSARKRKARRLENYEQFDADIRQQALEISEFYEIFYCLENSIRSLIADILKESEGADWWNSPRVVPEVKEEVAKRINKEIESAVTVRSEREIDYTTFGELSILISKNWDAFEPVFTSRTAVARVLSSLNTLRNPIAHCCPIAEDEKDRLVLSVKDWFRILA